MRITTIQNGTNHIDVRFSFDNRFLRKFLGLFFKEKYLGYWYLDLTPLSPNLKDAMNEKLSRINVSFYFKP